MKMEVSPHVQILVPNTLNRNNSPVFPQAAEGTGLAGRSSVLLAPPEKTGVCPPREF